MYKTFIKISKRGVYTFKLISDNNAFVKMHEFNLLDADFDYKAGEVIQRSVTLDAGYHPVTIYYLKNQIDKGGVKLQFKVASGIWEDLGEKNCFY